MPILTWIIGDSGQGTLLVQIDGSSTEEFDVFIAVTQFKVFDRGGKLKDGGHYGFFSEDGNIPLTFGTKVAVFV